MSDTIEASMSSAARNVDVEQAVRDRYSAASRAPEAALCCPVNYEARYLELLPKEIIERDYGCGNPSEHLQEGDHVLDLGSGGGKICFIASQIVGPDGSVIGVDMNDDMLALARKYQQEVGDRIGWHNVDFRKGRIQDLALSIDRLEQHLREHPIHAAGQWLETQQTIERLRREEPLVANDSVDVVISNCVLNLVRREDRKRMFSEIHRVLRTGGRAVISDIVSDKPVPDHLQADPKLWSGCISGAFVEFDFLRAFEEAGFYGLEVLTRSEEPWTEVEGIEFRSLTVRAYKEDGESGAIDQDQVVVYRGPWQSVTDDAGRVLRRGVRTAVGKQSFEIYTRAPYADQVIAVSPREELNRAELPIAGCCDSNNCCS